MMRKKAEQLLKIFRKTLKKLRKLYEPNTCAGRLLTNPQEADEVVPPNLTLTGNANNPNQINVDEFMGGAI